MNNALPNFKTLAQKYAKAQTDAERLLISEEAKQLMENYINQGDITEQQSRIEEILQLMKQDLAWLQSLN
jgi:hypothetical protein